MNSFVFGILLLIFVGERVDGVKIQFFKPSNFRELHYESSSVAKCNNMPHDKKDVIIVSKKNDTCLMVYKQPNCGGYGSKKLEPDNISFWGWSVGSYHICNEEIGGHQLKIDITKYRDYSESGVLQSYRDVCTCINVPQYLQNMNQWSINNYGNDFLAYYQPNCIENKLIAERIPAGLWCSGSGCMQNYKHTDSVTRTMYKIQSIGPNPNSKYFKTSCSQVPVNNQTKNSGCVENGSSSVSGTELRNLQQISSTLATKYDQLENRLETVLTEIEALKDKTVELELNPDKQCRNLEDSIGKPKVEFWKELQNYQQKQDHKIEQLEKHIDTLLTENQALNNKTVELKSELENQYKSYEDSLEKMKHDFRLIFA